MTPRTYEEIAKTIDHSLLRPEMTETEVATGCELAKQYHVASVCVKPCDVLLAAKILAGSDVKVSTVIGFPHGTTTTETKVFEAKQAISRGCTELDMVLNIGWLRSGKDAEVEADIRAVVEAAHAENVLVKVILENAYLSEDEKVRACQIVDKVGGDWVKTSTGFAPSGATIPDLKLMRQTVSDKVQVKAAGGIRTLDALLEALETGITRAGATATKVILEEFQARQKDGKVTYTPNSLEKAGY